MQQSLLPAFRTFAIHPADRRNTLLRRPGKRHLHVLVLIGLCLSSQASAFSGKTTLRNALYTGLVTVHAKAGIQHYNEKGLSLKIANTSKKTLELTIDPALVFRPDDTSYQDLVITGNISMTIEPGKSKNIDLQSYCAKSYARAPSGDIHFAYWKQADSNMIRVLDYAQRNRLSNDII